MNNIYSDKKVLFFDIETKPLLAYIWQLGEQHVRHGQLKKGYNEWDVISIAYSWAHEEEVHVMGWGYEQQDSSTMLRYFDELIKEADIVIGKNNERFDNKHLNFHRWRNNRDGMPDWSMKSDDLEKHLRKHLKLPSQSLDYISDILGLGGKEKMEFSDWVHIVEKTPELGEIAYEKMLHYNKKDVSDTKAIWMYSVKHFMPKHKLGISSLKENGIVACDTCGSFELIKNGTRYSGKTKYQMYVCNTHGGYATMIPIKGK